jgi:hypothetical protein
MSKQRKTWTPKQALTRLHMGLPFDPDDLIVQKDGSTKTARSFLRGAGAVMRRRRPRR